MLLMLASECEFVWLDIMYLMFMSMNPETRKFSDRALASVTEITK